MFPKAIDKIHCLQGLIGSRTACDYTEANEPPFFIEDIEGVDMPTLASVAKATNLSGKDFANQLISSAAREMMGDIELLLNNGYRMNAVVGDVCSACTLLPTYTVNSGIVVKSVVASRFQTLHITSLNVLVNVTADKQIKIDDGVDPKYYTASFTAGVVQPINLNYKTNAKSVKISFVDVTVPLGQISCATQTGCGCGGSPKANNPISISGLLAGTEVPTQYGFLACAAVSCNYDSLVCNLIKQTPNIFGMVMMFKVGEKYSIHRDRSLRNNEVVSYNSEKSEKSEVARNYGKLYWMNMKGGKNQMSVKKIVNDYLKTVRADKCIVCESKVMTAYATG